MEIIIVLIILCFLYIVYKSYKENMKFLDIKINNIEEKLSSTLIKRKELIKESELVIKDVIKTKKQIYDGLSNLNDKKTNMIELDRKLVSYINEFNLIESRYKKLKGDERFQKIYFSISETEDLLNAYKEYYNNVALEYNKTIKKFPIIIFSKLKGKNEKLFFDKKTTNDNVYNYK